MLYSKYQKIFQCTTDTHTDYRTCHVFNVRATSTESNMALVVARQGWGILSLRWALSETNEWRLSSWNCTWTRGKNVRSGNEEGDLGCSLAWADFSKHVLFFFFTAVKKHGVYVHSWTYMGVHRDTHTAQRHQHLRVIQKLNQHRL